MKNNTKVFLVCTVTIITVIILSLIYDKYQDYNNKTPILEGTLVEIKTNDFDSYLFDNDFAVVYIGVVDDKNCRELEKDLKEIFTERELTEKIVYLNISDEKDKVEYLEIMNNKYADGINVTNYPALVVFNERKIVDLIERKNDQFLTSSEVEVFLDAREIE